MASTDYSEFFPYVLPSVPGCSSPMATDAIRTAAIDFCERSRAWTDNLTMSALANTGAYPFVPPAGSAVAEILQAWFNGLPIDPKTPDELRQLYTNWRTESGNEPEFYTQEDTVSVTLVPMPEAALADAIKLRVALAPAADSTGVDTRIFNKYRTDIAAGALAILLKIPGEKFYNPNLAQERQATFNAAIADANYKAAKGFVRARRRVTKNYF